jgi:phage FluMu protein Com
MTDTIKVRCKQCGNILKASPEKAGKKGKCPKCETVFRIPEMKAIDARNGERILLEEKPPLLEVNEALTESKDPPLFSVMYTEASPFPFALKRKNMAPLLDLSEKGLGFIIKTDEKTSGLIPGKIMTIEIDFPILEEPINVPVEISWIKKTSDNSLLRMGVQFCNQDKELKRVINKLIKYIMTRPDVWEVD